MSLIFRTLLSGSVAFASLSLSAAPAVAQDVAELARRIAAAASIAVDEYALGVVDGRVVLVEEYDEARLFLEAASESANQLPADARADAISALDRLLASVHGRRSVEDLRTDVTSLRAGLERTLGVTLDPMPRTAPVLAVGAERYQTLCAQCHGATGGGDGPLAAPLTPPPTDLTDAALAATSPVEFFRKISVGVAGTAMPGFADQLTIEERWSLALYASGLRHAAADRGAGAAWVAEACPGCRVVLSGLSGTATASDDSLLALMVAEAGVAPADTAAVLAYARTAAAVEVLGDDRALAARRVARRALVAAEAALPLVAGQSAAAAREVLAGYLVFEEIESAVAARDARVARTVERAFGDLRAAAARGDSAAATAAYAQVAARVAEAVGVLETPASVPLLFGQSLLIMVREGLEAILIIGALIAFLVKAGAEHRVREIGWGALGAIAASFLTAGLFAFIFRVSTAHQEALEGITMLLAAAVLFTVASWLVSKIEADRWRSFVSGQMTKAMASRGKIALVGLAFLVVYREGFETVLFYAALFASADSAAGGVSITAGMGVGAVALAVVYVAIRRYGVRLPLRPIFAVTGVLLLVLAFSFAGQGMAELQEAGLIPLTPLAWIPVVPFLGLFPTVQTLTAQLVVAAAFLVAVTWFYWWQPRAARVRA